LLFALYLLQGLPFGLVTGSLPLLISGGGDGDGGATAGGHGNYRGASYLSIATLPYAFKLLWAPYVDTTFSRRLGRRRSWVIPVNAVACLLWYELSRCVDSLVIAGSSSGSTSESSSDTAMVSLGARLFCIVLVMAIGDVAVDGWALTVDRHLLSAAALAQTIGMTCGNLITNAGVICAQSGPCYRSVLGREVPVPLESFALFACVLHVAATVAVVFLTTESAGGEDEGARAGECRTPRELLAALWALRSRKHVQALLWLLLTSRVAFALTESGTLPSVEFVAAGGDLSQLAAVIALQYPVQMALGALVSIRLRTGSPTSVWLAGHDALLALAIATPLVTGIVCALVGPRGAAGGAAGGWVGAFGLGLVMAATSTVNKALFIAVGTFFNSISDVDAGGTMVTALNSLSNFGRFMPRLPALWLAGSGVGPLRAAVAVAAVGVLQRPAVAGWIGLLGRAAPEDWELDARPMARGGASPLAKLSKFV